MAKSTKFEKQAGTCRQHIQSKNSRVGKASDFDFAESEFELGFESAFKLDLESDLELDFESAELGSVLSGRESLPEGLGDNCLPVGLADLTSLPVGLETFRFAAFDLLGCFG